MTLFFLSRQQSGARVGFTVGRAMGGAVDRNRIKRRLREAARSKWQRLEAAVDVVVNPKKSALRADFREITQDMGRAFEVITGKMRDGAGRTRRTEKA
jgi:ribonuclease P protein component